MSLLTSVLCLTLNSWNHIVFTRTGTTDRLYLNGVLRGTSTSDNSIGNVYSTIYLARANIGAAGQSYLDGRVDDLTIWSKVLGQSDVDALYASGSGATPIGSGISLSGLKAYYNFEQTSGNLINQAIPWSQVN